MDSSNAATFCDGCDHLTAGREACAGQRDRAQSSRRWYLCGNFHRTGVTGRFGNMHPGHLQRSRRRFLHRDGRLQGTNTNHVVKSTGDPVLCWPCTLVRWRRVLDTEAAFKSVKALFKDAEVVTADSDHPCHAQKPIDPRTLDAPLFPPINQMGTDALPARAPQPTLHLEAGAAGRHRPRPPQGAGRRRSACRG